MRLLVLLVILGSISSEKAEAQCELEGTLSHDALRVRAGSETLRIRVQEASVVVRPTRGDAEVRVESSLRFTATASVLPYYIRNRVETGHGMISLTRDMPLDHVRTSRGELTASVMLNPWVRIRRLRFPCASIVLGREQTEEPDALQASATPVDHVQPTRRVLSIHTAPRADAPRVRVRLEREAPFMLARFRQRNGWAEVEWNDGSNRIRGWVRRDDVRSSHGHGWGTTGGHGTPGCVPRGRASIVGGYEGPAEITEGTEVLYAPNGARWATVGTGRFVVRWGPSDTHAAIVEASGLRVDDLCGMRHAFVPRDAVTPR